MVRLRPTSTRRHTAHARCCVGLLRGFDGYVTSDSGAVANIYQTHHYTQTAAEAAAAAFHAGTDINSGTVYLDDATDAISQGLMTWADVDLALTRTLKLRFLLGLFDPIEDQPYWHVPPTDVNTPESQAFNLFSTQQSIVLLKNDANTLPFKRGQRVAVVGPHANATQVRASGCVCVCVCVCVPCSWGEVVCTS